VTRGVGELPGAAVGYALGVGEPLFLYVIYPRRVAPTVVSDLGAYLRGVCFRNGTLFDCARVATCRSWRATGGETQPYDLHWNSDSVPGEALLGRVGIGADVELVARIAAELGHGEAVRFFVYNRDSDVCIEEVLVPASACPGAYRHQA
jgi:hypothetical protein